MAITTVSDLNGHYSDLYQLTWFQEREWELMPNLVSTREATGMTPRILKQYGQTTAGTIAEGGTPTATNQTITSHGTVIPEIAIYYGILTDEQMATNPEDSVTQLATEAGMALGQQVDQKIIAEFSNFDNSVGSGGASMTLSKVQAALAYLVAEKAIGPRQAVVGAGQWLDLSREVTQSNAATFQGNYGELANEAMREYFSGRFLNTNWYQDINIGTTGTAGTATGGLFVPRAIILDERDVGGDTMVMEVNRPRHGGRDDITWRYRRGTSVDHSDEGVQLISSNAITE